MERDIDNRRRLFGFWNTLIGRPLIEKYNFH